MLLTQASIVCGARASRGRVIGRIAALLLVCLSACGFPSAYQPPLYPGASIISRYGTSDEGTIVLLTPDEPQRVIAFYQEALAKDGWTSNYEGEPERIADQVQAGGLGYEDRNDTVPGWFYLFVDVTLARDGSTRIEIRCREKG